MYVTFGNGSPASLRIGETSVALRIIYEYFFSGTMKHEQFLRIFRNRTLKIAGALNVILEDVDSDRDENNYYIRSVVFCIDELNVLHRLMKF